MGVVWVYMNKKRTWVSGASASAMSICFDDMSATHREKMHVCVKGMTDTLQAAFEELQNRLRFWRRMGLLAKRIVEAETAATKTPMTCTMVMCFRLKMFLEAIRRATFIRAGGNDPALAAISAACGVDENAIPGPPKWFNYTAMSDAVDVCLRTAGEFDVVISSIIPKFTDRLYGRWKDLVSADGKRRDIIDRTVDPMFTSPGWNIDTNDRMSISMAITMDAAQLLSSLCARLILPLPWKGGILGTSFRGIMTPVPVVDAVSGSATMPGQTKDYNSMWLNVMAKVASGRTYSIIFGHLTPFIASDEANFTPIYDMLPMEGRESTLISSSIHTGTKSAISKRVGAAMAGRSTLLRARCSVSATRMGILVRQKRAPGRGGRAPPPNEMEQYVLGDLTGRNITTPGVAETFVRGWQATAPDLFAAPFRVLVRKVIQCKWDRTQHNDGVAFHVAIFALPLPLLFGTHANTASYILSAVTKKPEWTSVASLEAFSLCVAHRMAVMSSLAMLIITTIQEVAWGVVAPHAVASPEKTEDLRADAMATATYFLACVLETLEQAVASGGPLLVLQCPMRPEWATGREDDGAMYEFKVLVHPVSLLKYLRTEQVAATDMAASAPALVAYYCPRSKRERAEWVNP